jgi:hypothetical protein
MEWAGYLESPLMLISGSQSLSPFLGMPALRANQVRQFLRTALVVASPRCWDLR